MELKLACADFSFPLVPHDDAIDLIARLGLKGVDIGLFPNRSHFQPKDFLNDIPGAVRQLSAKVRDSGLEFADVFLQSGATLQEKAENHPDAAVRKESRDLFLRTLDFVVRCNAKHMTSLPGVTWETESAEESLKRCSTELAWRVEQANKAGIIYSIEPHVWSITPTPAAAMKLIQMTPGLTITLDYTHYTSQGTPDAQIEPLIRHASHFHARGATKGLVQTTLAKNTIDYAGVVKAMKRDGYKGWVGIEYVRMNNDMVPDVDNLAETVLLRDLLRKAAA